MLKDLEQRRKACEATRRWRSANPERVRELSRRRYAANPEKSREISREASRRYRERNPNKHREYMCKWRAANLEKVRYSERKNHLKRNYGITLDQYNQLLTAQNGCCAICGTITPSTNGSKLFVVDHCHNTDKIRGLLCHSCNVAIGHLKESPNILRAAARYLEKHK